VKTLLTEKNPNPLAPFAFIMPTLITDPRYVLLSSQSEREVAFNEWCRETARKTRLANSSSIAPAGATAEDLGAFATQKDSSTLDPATVKQHAREAYDSLLKVEVTSTRIRWEEFRRKWKKDRRFFAFGRDEREREKVFRAWLRDLGERKSGNLASPSRYS
jgi:transcription elongation regulator 1